MPKSYDYHLVALSAFVAVLVSHTALSLFLRMSRHGGAGNRAWLCGGAAAMGCGIWAMHFLGMLALQMPIRLTYDLRTTLASLILAIGASLSALSVVSRSRQPSTARLIASSSVLGGGISAMHYMGMAAIQIIPGIAYDRSLLVVSVGIAAVGSFLALLLFFRTNGSPWRTAVGRGSAACVLGLSIAGMHYTGMLASEFRAGAYCIGAPGGDSEWLAVLVAILATALMAIMTVMLAYDGYLSAKTHEYNKQLESANDRLRHTATHDALTGLPNRILMTRVLDELIARPREPSRRFAVLLIDLDRFKEVNDSLGHLAGDQLLCVLSARVSAQIRSGDVLARLGGDEFVVLADNVGNISEAATLSARLLRAIVQPVALSGLNVHVAASIGIAVGPDDGADSTELLRRADAAMYHVKNNGRNGYQVFSKEVQIPSRDRLEVDDGLHTALVANQFELHYQPKVDARTDRIDCAEALIRWRHPVQGLIPPADFIPLAEETGLIVSLGEWALREACRQICLWQQTAVGSIRVAVNVSAQQFRQRDFVALVTGIVHESGIDPALLELELTESAVMRDAQSAVAALRALADLGVGISLDDFGTGYSSLSYLRRLPLQKLKIDRSFLQELEADGSTRQIVRAIISLAHNLHLRVIAEGVETVQQLRFLREAGCDEYQGFYFSKPLPAPEFARFLADQRTGRGTARWPQLLARPA